MSPHDIPPVPTNIPDDLWFDIQRVRRRLASFIADAQLSVRDDEARTGQHDISFYAWLQPLAKAVTELRKAQRHAPSAANVIAFPQNVRRPEAGRVIAPPFRRAYHDDRIARCSTGAPPLKEYRVMGEVLTVSEVCRKLHIARETLRRWERDGWFPKRIRFSRAARGRVGYLKADVLRWMKPVNLLPNSHRTA